MDDPSQDTEGVEHAVVRHPMQLQRLARPHATSPKGPPMTAPDLVRQILAAIEETEQMATMVPEDRREWRTGELGYEGYVVMDGKGDRVVFSEQLGVDHHIARHDPASVLRRCAADRKLVELHRQSSELGWLCELCGGEGQNIDCTYPCDTLRLVADGYGITPESEASHTVPAETFAADLAEAHAGDTVPAEVIARDLAERAAASAAVHQEEDWFVAQASAPDVASQGRTEAEARANLREAVELYLTSEKDS